LSVIFYECETSSVALREEHESWEPDNRDFERLLAHEGESNERLEKFRNEKFHTQHSPPYIRYTRITKLRRIR
jgi:hypothetical protein